MKIGRRGFMLAEVVVVSVVVVTVLVTLFTGVNNVSSAYETRNRYYDVDSLYIAMEINDIIIDEKIISVLQTNNNITNLKNNVANSERMTNYVNFYEDKDKGTGNVINSLYFVPYDVDKLNSLKNEENINISFKDYITYLSGNLDFSEDYDYMIIVERYENNNIDDCYYYALKLKY